MGGGGGGGGGNVWRDAGGTVGKKRAGDGYEGVRG